MEKSVLRHCCICSHFRMWKPQKMYCTVKQEVVDPLKENEPCWKLRKGLRFFKKPNAVILNSLITYIRKAKNGK